MSYAPGAYYMANHGGHFAKCLAADTTNRERMEQAFAALFSHYTALAVTKTEVA
jgi:hypothetical protein